jgi:hypothetical protein
VRIVAAANGSPLWVSCNEKEMTNHPLFTTYLKELSAVTQQGDAREESFYPALAEMLAAVAKSTGRKRRAPQPG